MIAPLTLYLFQGGEAEEEALSTDAVAELYGDLNVQPVGFVAHDHAFTERGVAYEVADMERGLGQRLERG